MSKANRTASDQVIESDTEEVNNDIDIDDAEDYGFIIGPDGELKHMFWPEGFDLDPPKTVRRILKVFGIKDINLASEEDTLH